MGSKSGLRSESRGWKPLERAGLWSSGLAQGGVVSEDTGGLGVSLGSAFQELCDLSSQMSSLGRWGEIARPPSQDVERIQRGTPASLLPGSVNRVMRGAVDSPPRAQGYAHMDQSWQGWGLGVGGFPEDQAEEGWWFPVV